MYNIGKGKVKFEVQADGIDLDERESNHETGKAAVDVLVDVKANKALSKTASFYLEYSNAVLELVQPDVGVGYSIDRSKTAPGAVFINIDDTSVGNYRV